MIIALHIFGLSHASRRTTTSCEANANASSDLLAGISQSGLTMWRAENGVVLPACGFQDDDRESKTKATTVQGSKITARRPPMTAYVVVSLR